MTSWHHRLACGLAFTFIFIDSTLHGAGLLGIAQTPKQTPAPAASPASEPGDGADDRTPVTPSNPIRPSPEVQPRPGAVEGATDSQLQSVIQKALRNEPTLAEDNLSATVSANTIELSGSVANSRELLTAMRIAHSYAGSKWLVNHIQVHQPKAAVPEPQAPDKPEPRP
ncbi:MAG TPA: BON domain-containing protein [Candidatus Acidoferrales bacterium]|nr:BON domain-containing protein [Candidatus Acidoferrales bacterium]